MKKERIILLTLLLVAFSVTTKITRAEIMPSGSYFNLVHITCDNCNNTQTNYVPPTPIVYPSHIQEIPQMSPTERERAMKWVIEGATKKNNEECQRYNSKWDGTYRSGIIPNCTVDPKYVQSPRVSEYSLPQVKTNIPSIPPRKVGFFQQFLNWFK